MKEKQLKKEVRKALCALLTAAMLFTDTGMTAFAQEETRQTEETRQEADAEESAFGETNTPTEEAAAQETSIMEGTTEQASEERASEEEETESTCTENASDENTMTNESTEAQVVESTSTEESSTENTETESGSNEETVSEEDTDMEETETVSETETEAEESVNKLAFSDSDIAHGEYKQNGSDITWVIDAEGKLTVEGTGNFRSPWGSNNAEKIKSAVINVKGATSAMCMFQYCRNLTSVDLSGFDTSKVTNMGSMFAFCSSLTSVDDVSKFDTSNVTSMNTMFWDCSSLTSVDVSRFDTNKVTDMGAMFKGCSSLTSVDVSKFGTSKVTNMSDMFCGCNSLTDLDVSNFDTSNVTDMFQMFASCNSLTSVDVSNFDTSKVTNMRDMFSYCGNLTSVDVSKFDTNNVTNMQSMFSGCSSLTSVGDVSNFDTSNVTDMKNMFSGCSSLTALDVSKFDTSRVINMQYMFGSCSRLTALDVGDFDTSRVTGIYGMRHMFDGCSNLTNLDVSKFDTSTVTDMSYMFSGCSSLMALDVSKFDTSSVIDMDCMFLDCSSLTDLDVTNFDTSSVVNMWGMFRGCSGLANLDIRNFDTSSVTDMGNMFTGCSGLKNLDVSSFDTSSVTDMSSMFTGCSSLASLDIGNFDTSSVTKMGYMFGDCNSLTNLDLNIFNTSNVKNMGSMFSGCGSLTNLELKNFDTSSVTDMGSMFSGCGSLTNLDLSRFDTSNVKNISSMFINCSSLTNLDLSRFDTSSVTSSISSLFSGCSKLKSVDLSSFNTENIEYMSGVFSGCSSLTSLDLSSFDVRNVKYHLSLSDCSSLTQIYLPRNLSSEYTLPTTGTWYDMEGNTYNNYSPKTEENSILLCRDEAPQVSDARIVAKKVKTSYTCGETLNTDDITVSYYAADATARVLAQTQYTTNAADIRMDTAGEKILTVTYSPAGGSTLTADIRLNVGTLLDSTSVTVTLPGTDAYDYVFDRKTKKPVPTVVYNAGAEPVTLTENTDYTVSYKNNKNAYKNTEEDKTAENAPAVIITGCGSYTGKVIKTFEIKKAAPPAAKEIVKKFKTGGNTSSFSFYFDNYFPRNGNITSYTAGTPIEDDTISGNVLNGEVSVYNGSSSSFSCRINEKASAGDFVTVPVTVSFANYEDTILNVKIVIEGASVETKKKVKIAGIEVNDRVYNKIPVSYKGTAKVTLETDNTDLTNTVKLTYTYSGTQADNSPYAASSNAPVNAGSYKLTVAVATDNADYTGSTEYSFKITKAPLTITARDMRLKIGADLPKAEDYLYDTAGLLTGDTLTTAPTLSCNITDTAKAGTYDIIASNADAGMNYEITYKNGTLTVSETGENTKYYTVTYNMNGHGNDITNTGVKEGSLLEKPQDPQAEGYTFTGWYKDAPCTTKWDFATDTVQADTTLYAGWKKKDAGSEEDASWYIGEIAPTVYTGKAIKPTVIVYGSDGALLKAGTHYTIIYKNNTEADRMAAAGGTRNTQNGVMDGFNEELPHVIITGKGNYTGSVYKNFHIYPASISGDGETPAKGFTLKYTEQLVTANKAQKPFASIKYKKAMTLGKDYELEFSKYAADGSLQLITSGSTLPSIPANDTGTFRLVITGKGNYSGTVGMDIYVGGKDSLMKNAKITLGKDIKNVSYTGADITPQASAQNGTNVFTVKFGNKYLTPETDYTVSYRNNRAAGTATIIVRGKGQYIGTKSAAFTIKGTPFKTKDAAVKNFEASKTYTGSAIEQGKDGVTIGGKTLDYGTDYTVAYKNNVKKGTATVTFRANPESGYSGSFNKTFKITAADLSSAAAEFSDYTVTGTGAERRLDKNVPYSKEGAQPAGSLRLTGANGRTLQNGTDYTVSYANHKKTGAEAVMTIKGKGNYTGKITVKYTVGKASLVANEKLAQSCTPVAFNAAKADSYLYKPKFKLTDGKKALSAKTDYKQLTDESYINCTQDKVRAYLDALESGSVTGTALEEMRPCVIIDAADNGSYTDSTKVYLTIYRTKLTKNALDVQVTGGDIYTGKQVTPAVTVKLRADGRTLAEGRDYMLSYGANTAAGRNKGSVTVIGTGLYGGSVTVKFDIKSRDINKR